MRRGPRPSWDTQKQGYFRRRQATLKDAPRSVSELVEEFLEAWLQKRGGKIER